MKQLSMYDDALLEHDVQGVQTPAPCRITTLPEACSEASAPNSSELGARANVTEIILAKGKAENIQMLLPMLTHLNQEKRWLAWIDPPMELLQQWRNTLAGEYAEDLMILRSSKTTTAAELSRRALAAGTCHAVITWTEQLSNPELESLEEASALGNSHGIVLRLR